MNKKPFILKYKHNNKVEVLEIIASTEKAVTKGFQRMKIDCSLYGAELLEVKPKGLTQNNLFSTHPTLEDFHI